MTGVTFPLLSQGRHLETLMSELNSWPTLPLPDATPLMLPINSVWLETKVIGDLFFAGLFHS